jgi:isopenicillin N synthase-like dioxygenase
VALGGRFAANYADPMSSTPVYMVDLEPFRLGDVADRSRVAAQIDTACRDSGFVQITGHGVPLSVSDRLIQAWNDFSSLPASEKSRWTVPDRAANRGWTAVGSEALAYSLGQKTPPDLVEAFVVGRSDTAGADGEYVGRHRLWFAPNVWPHYPADFYDAWVQYESAVHTLQDLLLVAMAMALELPERWFIERTRRSVITTRMLRYERLPGTPDPDPGQMRLGAHTDYGIVTILLADEVPGLQICCNNEWIPVSTPRGSFTCNIGDLLAQWTNDRWNSTLHRVVPPPVSVDGPVLRRSIARFLDSEPDMMIECIPTCVSAANPARYAPVNGGEWLLAKVTAGRTPPTA